MSECKFDDKQMLTDTLSSQKFITGIYNECANESAKPAVRNVLMSILADEHEIQAEVFDEMSKRNWYQTTNAEAQKVDEAKTKFVNIMSSL